MVIGSDSGRQNKIPISPFIIINQINSDWHKEIGPISRHRKPIHSISLGKP